MLAIIGGTGLAALEGLTLQDSIGVETPYGTPSANIERGELNGSTVFFLARHGKEHSLTPHSVNYRANIWALQSLGVTRILGVNAVGGINDSMGPEVIVIPDQIIDYTWGRQSSFSEENNVIHADFTYPYTEELRQRLLEAAEKVSVSVCDGGVYGATQGPRLETAAEINRLEKDGCDIVGMTAMPEAILARELDMQYANISLVVNNAAGRSEGLITMDDIQRVLDAGMGRVRMLLGAMV